MTNTNQRLILTALFSNLKIKSGYYKYIDSIKDSLDKYDNNATLQENLFKIIGIDSHLYSKSSDYLDSVIASALEKYLKDVAKSKKQFASINKYSKYLLNNLDNSNVRQEILGDLKNLLYDNLTGLYKEKTLDYFSIKATNEAISNNTDANLILFTLRNLKEINDKLGHVKGDEYINSFVKLLSSEEGQIVRIGGDRFALLPNNQNNANDILSSIKSLVAQYNLSNKDYSLCFSSAVGKLYDSASKQSTSTTDLMNELKSECDQYKIKSSKKDEAATLVHDSNNNIVGVVYKDNFYATNPDRPNIFYYNSKSADFSKPNVEKLSKEKYSTMQSLIEATSSSLSKKDFESLLENSSFLIKDSSTELLTRDSKEMIAMSIDNFHEVVMDLNDLGLVNSKLGEKAGNLMISHFTELTKLVLPENAHFFRMGGDEFDIILPNSNSNDLEKLSSNMRKLFTIYNDFEKLNACQITKTLTSIFGDKLDSIEKVHDIINQNIYGLNLKACGVYFDHDSSKEDHCHYISNQSADKELSRVKKDFKMGSTSQENVITFVYDTATKKIEIAGLDSEDKRRLISCESHINIEETITSPVSIKNSANILQELPQLGA